jgi:phospholipase C
MAGAGFGAAVLPLNLRKALVETLANPPKARLTDIKNIVILMQENRSFDHYFGTMPGVRGFSDPTAWKAGGFVCSDVFDHTSLIRFIEARFGVREPNISAWRRRTCGDFTSAFRFSRPARPFPVSNTALQVAAAETALLAAQQEVSVNPAPTAPSVNQPLPFQ